MLVVFICIKQSLIMCILHTELLFLCTCLSHDQFTSWQVLHDIILINSFRTLSKSPILLSATHVFASLINVLTRKASTNSHRFFLQFVKFTLISLEEGCPATTPVTTYPRGPRTVFRWLSGELGFRTSNTS